MNSRLAAPIALGLLLIGGAVWVLRARNSEHGAVPLPTPAAGQPEVLRPDEASPREAIPPPTEPAVDLPVEPLRARLHGRVIDEQGVPVAAGRVELCVLEFGSIPRESPPRRGSTDGEGHFQFDAVRAFGPRCRLRVEAAGFPALELHEPSIQPGDCDLGDIVLLRSASVSGRVVDPLGRGVEGALVSWIRDGDNSLAALEAREHGLLTSADGSFLLRDLPADSLRLAADAEGFRSDWTAPLKLRSGASVTGLEIDLEVALPVRGIVRDRASQEPVRASVRLLIQERRREFVLVSGADGRFEAWAGLPFCTLLAKAYPLGEEASGRDEVHELGPPGSLLPELTLYLERGKALELRVLDAQSGAPIRGARLAWIGDVAGAAPHQNPLLFASADPVAQSDEAGRIHLEPDSRSWNGAVVSAPEHAPTTLRLVELGVADAEVRLDAGARLAVQVRDAGNPAAGVLVELACDGPDVAALRGPLAMRPRYVVARGETNANGEASLACMPTFAYTLLARSSGRVCLPKSVVLPNPGETLRVALDLQPAGSIRGRVTRDGAPARWTDVVAQFGSMHTFTSRTDDSGRFRFEDLAAGMYDLYALSKQRPSVQIGLRTCTLRAGEELEVELAEETSVALRGSVRINQRPAFGVVVRFERDSDRRLYGSSPEECTTDPAGRFELRVPAQATGRLTLLRHYSIAGEVELAVREPFSVEAAPAEIALDLEAGAVEIEVLRTGTSERLRTFLQFVLRPDPEAGGVPGFVPQFEWHFAMHFGRLSLPALPIGNYLLEIEKPRESKGADAKLHIRGAGTETLQLSYDPRK